MSAREPNSVPVLMLYAMLDRLPERPQPKRLPDNETVKGKREHQRLPLGLLEELFELVNDHVGELSTRVVAERQGSCVVELHRIGDGQ